MKVLLKYPDTLIVWWQEVATQNIREKIFAVTNTITFVNIVSQLVGTRYNDYEFVQGEQVITLDSLVIDASLVSNRVKLVKKEVIDI